MANTVVDALSITITTLQEKISTLEEEVNGYRASDISKAASVWVVYSPDRLSVWCHRSDCPRQARKVKYSTGTEDELQDAILGKDELPADAIIIDISEPTLQNHPLGLLATFLDEGSAQVYVDNWHRKNRVTATDNITLSVCEIPLN